jgi:transcriptional regulator with GAF, ATPase, and Fis domain
MDVFHNEMNVLKRSLIERTLDKANGNRLEAARMLGITKRYLNRLIHNLGI